MVMKNRNGFLSAVSALLLAAFVNNPALAQSDLARLQAISPAANVLVSQGGMFVIGGKYKDAIDAFSKAIQLEPKSAMLYKCRGDAYRSSGQSPLALADYDTAIKLDPAYVDAYGSRGQAKYDQHQFQSAIPDLSKAVDFEKNVGGSMEKLNLLDSYLATKQYAKVVELSTLGHKSMPWAAFLLRRAEAYIELGEYQKAIEDCDAAIKMDRGMEIATTVRAEAVQKLAASHR